MATLFSELKRRNVFRVGVAYLVASWLVVEVASVLSDIYAAPGWVLKVAVGLLVLGLPLVLVFSWAFELTPEGLRRESEVVRDASVVQQTARRLDTITIALLVGVAGLVIWDRLVGDRGTVATDASTAAVSSTLEGAAATNDVHVEAGATAPSIAVLPFADMSPQKDQEYFSDGIAEELLNLLAKVGDLKVAARTSSFRFKDPDHDITAIANTLGVNHVLEGSVRKAGNRVRVTAQLIDARDGFHVWSESYDQELTDILLVQDRIAEQIVEALSGHLGVVLDTAAVDTSPLVDAEAYEAYLKGNHAKHLRTPESMVRAVAHYETAVSRKPDFAAAWGGLARAMLLASEMVPERAAEYREQSLDAIDRALALDPDEAQALAVHATNRFNVNAEWAAGLEELERVVEAEPADSEAMSWLAQRYRVLGFMDRAEAHMRRAYEIDPLSPRVVLGIARTLAETGQHDEAARIAEKAWTDLAGHQYVVWAMLDVLLQAAELDDADAWLERLDPQHRGYFYSYRMSFAAARGEQDTLRDLTGQAQQAFQGVPLDAKLMGLLGHWLSGDYGIARQILADSMEPELIGAIAFWQVRPEVWLSWSETTRRGRVNLAPLLVDYPELVAAYAELGVDIQAEIEAAGMTLPGRSGG